jgi:Virulence-associated protein E/RepB DNA-primase from phage plasmid
MSAPIPDTEAALNFLDHMFGAGMTRHLVAINDVGKIAALSFGPTELEEARAWIEGRQGSANVYYSVNELKPSVLNRKAVKQDVARALHLHLDVDDPTALSRICEFVPKPTTVVFSGGGYQAFWKLREPTRDLNRVERINAELARKLGGDKCHNVDRVMRLPGTINVPNVKKRRAGRVPTLAYVVKNETAWSRQYPLDDFEDPGPEPPSDAMHAPSFVEPVAVDQLSASIFPATIELIKLGDDPAAPIGSKDAHFPSRSEAVWRVSCELARAGCSAELIAGILISPEHGISQSVLEKKRPNDYALRQAKQALSVVSSTWPDVTKEGRPRPTMRNAMVAMQRLGLLFAHDLFRYRKTVEGVLIQEYQGNLSDDACSALRHTIIDQFGFDVGKESTRDAAETLAISNAFHPIRNYLDSLQWDGSPRLDGWMSTYLGAQKSPLNSAIGRIVLIAAVRRVRSPGVKFDTILVLEGKQGVGKSSAVKILAGSENFSDQNILTLESKGQMELLEGVWIYELCELEGLSRAETTKVKAFASRSVDHGRPAYGRFKERRPRQTVLIGTTNEDQYLRDVTGNRRFWPVKVGKIDLEALQRDRDQLFAEAAYWEEKEESLVLPEELWSAAQTEQEARVDDDPWTDILSKLHPSDLDQVAGMVRVASTRLLGINLGLETDRQQQFHLKRLAGLMRKLGWEGPSPIKMEDGSVVRGYQRRLSDWGNPDDPSFKHNPMFFVDR